MTTTTLRASDADRQLVADRLAAHHAAGRLTLAEYDERLAKAYAAVYRDDFRPLFADLPDGGPRFDDEPAGGAGERAGFSGGIPFTRIPFDRRPRDTAGPARDVWGSPRDRVHPAVLVFAVLGTLVLVGVVVHVLVPLVVIGAVILLIGRWHRSGHGRYAGHGRRDRWVPHG